MKPHDLSTLANRLAYARGLSGLSQRALSERAGLDRTHVGHIERGVRNDLRYETGQRIATALGVSTAWLMSGEGRVPSERAVRAAVGRAA